MQILPPFSELVQSIITYGLTVREEPLDTSRQELKLLEERLVNLYVYSFRKGVELKPWSEQNWEHPNFADIEKTVRLNFPSFGFYQVVLDPTQYQIEPAIALEDSRDDLADIIHDLCKVYKESLGASSFKMDRFFEVIFKTHTKTHILGLLYYLDELPKDHLTQ